jgi:hypothetical protein
VNTQRKNDRIPTKWFLNVKRRALFAGLKREGWEKQRGSKHYQFTKEGYGRLIFPHGTYQNTTLTAQFFSDAKVPIAEVERILGRKPRRKKKPP